MENSSLQQLTPRVERIMLVDLEMDSYMAMD